MAHTAWSSVFRRIGVVLGAAGLALFTILMVGFSPFGWVLAPALVGGMIVAALLLRGGRFGLRLSRPVPDAFPGDLPTDVINMARIRVAGFGGLGLVALAVVIAFALPRVGSVMIIGLIGGALGALAIVLYRRRQGPMGSSSHGLPGARTMLIRPEDVPTDTHAAADERNAHERHMAHPAAVFTKSA